MLHRSMIGHCSRHAMLMNGRRDIADVGRYQTHEDAMQIVSGALHPPRVDLFLRSPVPHSHLWFESIDRIRIARLRVALA